mgnify:CR=1 FL=1
MTSSTTCSSTPKAANPPALQTEPPESCGWRGPGSEGPRRSVRDPWPVGRGCARLHPRHPPPVSPHQNGLGPKPPRRRPFRVQTRPIDPGTFGPMMRIETKPGDRSAATPPTRPGDCPPAHPRRAPHPQPSPARGNPGPGTPRLPRPGGPRNPPASPRLCGGRQAGRLGESRGSRPHAPTPPRPSRRAADGSGAAHEAAISSTLPIRGPRWASGPRAGLERQQPRTTEPERGVANVRGVRKARRKPRPGYGLRTRRKVPVAQASVVSSQPSVVAHSAPAAMRPGTSVGTHASGAQTVNSPAHAGCLGTGAQR